MSDDGIFVDGLKTEVCDESNILEVGETYCCQTNSTNKIYCQGVNL